MGSLRDDIRAARVAVETHKLRSSFEASRGAKGSQKLPTLRDILPVPLDIIEQAELGPQYALDKVNEQAAEATAAMAAWMKARKEAREKAKHASQSGSTRIRLPLEPGAVSDGPEQVCNSD